VPRLKKAGELAPGAAVLLDEAVQPSTRGWRTGHKPTIDLTRCVNCLLCWIYCPDSAVLLDGTTLVGFDYAFCKGCEICAEMCPTGAVTMVDEASAVPEHGASGEKTSGAPA
jgi:2-oxoacid:acceptor oxidoreductase delta subunit (pyruvate/2-ketoisovalerate family)